MLVFFYAVEQFFSFLILDMIVWNYCVFEFTVSENVSSSVLVGIIFYLICCHRFYEGTVSNYDSSRKKFTVSAVCFLFQEMELFP